MKNSGSNHIIMDNGKLIIRDKTPKRDNSIQEARHYQAVNKMSADKRRDERIKRLMDGIRKILDKIEDGELKIDPEKIDQIMTRAFEMLNKAQEFDPFFDNKELADLQDEISEDDEDPFSDDGRQKVAMPAASSQMSSSIKEDVHLIIDNDPTARKLFESSKNAKEFARSYLSDKTMKRSGAAISAAYRLIRN